ncbi:MAG: DNA polymerase I [Bacteroidales bacterium]|nr:DNA polymerase I [Bacteroidales bacterium]
MKTLYLVDAYALIYRAYYALLRMPRINSKGVNTSASFGFVNTFIDILNRRRPDYIVVAFDSHGPTFRHEMYDQYKANREAQPEDIRAAVPVIKEFLAAMNVQTIACPGFEADDIIGTLAQRMRGTDVAVYMVTPDKDYAQLVGDNVRMLRPHTGAGIDDWGESEVCEHWGVAKTSQIIDLLGLWGDSSDNIPGCPGVGEKRAKELLATFGSIDGIYRNINELKGKLKENLVQNREQVEMSRKLAVIVTDAPIEFNLADAALRAPDGARLQTLFAELEFRNVKNRIDALFPQSAPTLGGLFDQPAPASDASMGSLFDQSAGLPPQFATAQTVDHNYIVADTDDELQQLAHKMLSVSEFCFDTETTSVDTMTAEIVGLSVSFKEHEAYYVPFGTDGAESARRLTIFAPAFANGNILKIGQNLKFDINVLARYGVEVAGPMFDTMIAHFLMYPGLKHNMDSMAENLLTYSPIAIETLIGKGASQRSMRTVELQQIKEYAAEDADVTYQLYKALKPKIDADEALKKLFYDMEMPLMVVLADMERTGVKFDTQAMHNYAQVLKERISNVENHIKELAGCDFNVASPKQVGEVLFERLKIDSSVRKTRTGQYSTNEEILQKLAHNNPIVASILEYRGLVKLLNTYVEALPLLINKTTGRIHTNFNQTIVITGRLSSSNPNLQNIPIRDDDGREIRKAFIPSSHDNKILAADYSQVELRLMAHFSNDPHLTEAFINGEDIHAATAARIFNVSAAEVTKDMRRKAKTANFGIIYGISAFGLAERLDIPRKEAKDIIDGYFESFPGVRTYITECVEEVRRTGYVQTLFGRRRNLDDINSQNSVVRGVAERNAVNAPIQGTAADIIKIAMVNIFKELKDKGLKTKMILQVHDELVFDVPQDEIEIVSQIVKDKMESACALRVPLLAEIGIGDNWLEAH